MTSTTNATGNKLFHTYENVGYDADQQLEGSTYSNIPPDVSPILVSANGATSQVNCNQNHINNNTNNNNNICSNGTLITNNNNSSSSSASGSFTTSCTGASLAINKTAIESPFVAAAMEPVVVHNDLASTIATVAPLQTAKILSTATDSAGVTRMLTSTTGGPSTASSAASSSSSAAAAAVVASSSSASAAAIASTPTASGVGVAGGVPAAVSTSTLTTHRRLSPGQNNLVTKLITFPAQSPMDSLKEWSVSTFKCTKQLINEKRGICPVTNDGQLQNDIELLRENRQKLVQMLRYGQQMTNHYGQLVRTQKQLHALMNEMSIKCFATTTTTSSCSSSSTTTISNNPMQAVSYASKPSSKQVVANFSSLGNNLSSTTTVSPTHHRPSGQSRNLTEVNSFEDFLPVLHHMRSTTNLNLVDDFKTNAKALCVAIKNGEKLLAALNFYCSNLSTLINKTIEDTLTTVKQFESARLEYDAEKNSLNFISSTAQTSMTYTSEKLELARMRYEQLKEDVQIKMRLLEEHTTKVMHKQLLIFNGAFASYTSGNTAALDATLKQRFLAQQVWLRQLVLDNNKYGNMYIVLETISFGLFGDYQ